VGVTDATPSGELFRDRRRRRTLGRVLAEMGVIVFSVLLALAANEWRQGAARDATVDTVLEMVRTEVTRNRAQVVEALAHHESLLAQLRGGGIEMARVDLRTFPVDTTSAAAMGRSVTALLEAEMLASGNVPPPTFEARRLPDGEWLLVSEVGSIRIGIRGDTAVVRGTGNIALRPPFLVEAAWETAQLTQAAVHMDPEIVSAMAQVRQLHQQVEGTASRLMDMLYGTSAGRAEPLAALSDLVVFEDLLLQAYDQLLALLPASLAHPPG